MNNDNWLTVKEAAALIGVNTARVHALIQEGKVEAVKRGRMWFVSINSARERKAISERYKRLFSTTSW